MDELLKQAHALWREGRELEAISYLEKAVDACRRFETKERLIEVLNEYGGALRVVGRYEDGIAAIREAKELCEKKNLLTTEAYATTLVNLANVYREKKDLDPAEALFKEAGEIFRNIGLKNYSYIGLLNNYALLLQEKKKYEEAARMQIEAIELLRCDEKYLIPLAISFNNLYEIHKNLKNFEDANIYLEKARSIIEEKLGKEHPLYAAVLNNLADFYFNKGRHREALDIYEKALGVIKETYGEGSSPYKSIIKNIEFVKERLRTHIPSEEGVLGRTSERISEGTSEGTALAEKLYTRVLRFIEENYREVFEEVCIGLVGKGSECYGYDDELSKDHDFGERCMVFLHDATFRKYGEILENDLKKHFGRMMEVYSISGFYRYYTSFDKGPYSIHDFRRVSEEYLSTATNGTVFLDKRGEFTEIRQRLLGHYPPLYRLKLIAYHLNNMAQSGQYNLGRSYKRKDLVAASFALNEFMKHTIYLVHVINKKYTPFYKWSFKSVGELPILGAEMKEALESLVKAPEEGKEKIVEEICYKVVRYLNEEGLSTIDIDFLTYQADEVMKLIGDAELRRTDPWVR